MDPIQISRRYAHLVNFVHMVIDKQYSLDLDYQISNDFLDWATMFHNLNHSDPSPPVLMNSATVYKIDKDQDPVVAALSLGLESSERHAVFMEFEIKNEKYSFKIFTVDPSSKKRVTVMKATYMPPHIEGYYVAEITSDLKHVLPWQQFIIDLFWQTQLPLLPLYNGGDEDADIFGHVAPATKAYFLRKFTPQQFQNFIDNPPTFTIPLDIDDASGSDHVDTALVGPSNADNTNNSNPFGGGGGGGGDDDDMDMTMGFTAGSYRNHVTL